ncbi:MAG: LTA synthase family protein [Defluviitaleaceae bacterium]|nr:LTA synthase family protein [Defluviitaleaceae bacterium]
MMLIVKNILSKRPELHPAAGFALVLAAAAVLTYLMFAIQPFEPWLFERVLEENGFAVIALNFLPIALAVTVLYFATGNAALSSGLVGLVVVALSVANRFKIIFRQDPLTTWDFVLGAELAVISRSFSTRLIVGTIGGFVLMVVAVCVVTLLVRTRRMPRAVRAAGLTLSLLAAVVSTRTVLSDTEIFSGMYVSGNPYRMENQFNSRGFLYAFLHTHLTSEITQPHDFDAAVVSQQIAMFEFNLEERQAAPMVYVEPDMSRHPHVILVLAEAFSEFHLSPGITFPEGFDPAYNYRRLREESLYGYIVVPNYGGGTADTEFDILTGINTRHYRGMAYSYMLITREFPGLVSILNGLGYHSQALHPGFSWFYNRENVFEFLGFDNYFAGDDFYGAPLRGGYISEEYTFDHVLRRFDEHVEQRPGVPLFEFVITIQNHGPYDEKYNNAYTVEFESYPELSPTDINLLQNYFYGLMDVDRELGRLTDHMAASDEPVVIVYFSDHLPLVTRGILDAHQHPPAAVNHGYWPELWPVIGDFTTPFLIWQNAAAAELLEGRTTHEESGVVMSSFHLGAFILEFLGLQHADPFMYHISSLRTTIPVQLEFAYFDTEGRRFDYGEAMYTGVRLYKHWSYYRLFN